MTRRFRLFGAILLVLPLSMLFMQPRDPDDDQVRDEEAIEERKLLGTSLSQGAAALLRDQGVPAEVLEGGFDRIACPWLIRRFIDPCAAFLFVAPSDVVEVAERFGGVPFDIENVFWSHRGDTCTFDTMIEEFALGTAPLLRLATMVRGADTGRPEPRRHRLLAC